MHPFAGVAQFVPPRQVVAGGVIRALNAQRELAGLGQPLVGAGEVADEDFSEIYPAVDVAGLQAVQPCLGRALEHERNVFYGYMLVAVHYADCRGIVSQLIFRLHSTVVT